MYWPHQEVGRSPHRKDKGIIINPMGKPVFLGRHMTRKPTRMVGRCRTQELGKTIYNGLRNQSFKTIFMLLIFLLLFIFSSELCKF